MTCRSLLSFLTVMIFIMFYNPALAEEQSLDEIKFNSQTDNNILEINCIRDMSSEDEGSIDPYGIRDKLEKYGIMPEINHTTDNFLKLKGINMRKPIKSIGLVDYSLAIDTEKLNLIPGGTVYVLGQTLYSLNFNRDFIGDIQDFSSINAPVMTQLSEYWYRQSLADNKIKIKVGKQDANCDFDAIDSSSDFINSSFTLIPTVPMPSYPDQGLGIATLIKPTEKFNLKAGFFDGEANGGESGFNTFFDNDGGHFTIVEGGFSPTIKNHPGNYIAGYWHHSGDAEEISESSARIFGSDNGFYTAFEQSLYREKFDEENDQGLYIQGQFGSNPSDRNIIARYYGASFTYKGLLPKRDNDILGFGSAIADLTSRFSRRNETAIEGFYKIQITPWFAIQPDMQYIFNPGGENKDAFIIGVRTMVNF